MKKILIVLNILLFITACSTSTQISKETQKELDKIDSAKKEKAQDYFISGSVSEMKGDYEEAILDYQNALKLDPSPGIYYALSKNYLRLNKLAPALKNAKLAVEGDSTNSEYNYLLANIYTNANQVDSAANVYEKIISNDSTNVNAYYSLANIYEKDKPMEALKLYNRLLKIVGPEWNLLLNIADLNERLGNVEETIKTVENLVKLDPTNLKLKKLLIESYLKNGMEEKALKLTNELLIENPDDVNLQEYKANALVQSGDWDKGAEAYGKLIRNKEISLNAKIRIGAAFLAHAQQDSTSFERAETIFKQIDADTTDWQVKLYLGEISLRQKQDSSAVDYFKEAADLAPWNSEIFMRLGGLLFDSGRYDEVIETLSPAIKRFPDEFALNLILGLALVQKSESEKAEGYLKKALQLNPQNYTALYAYGITLNQLDKNEEALIYLNDALKQEPEDVQLLGTIGLIYENMDNYSKSEEMYERALAIDSTNALVLNNYAYALSERDKDLKRALKMSQKAIDFDPENASYLDTYGWIFYKLGEYQKAKEYIEKSLKSDPENAEVMYHLGDVYDKLGNSDKAVSLWKKAYKLDPKLKGLKEKLDKVE